MNSAQFLQSELLRAAGFRHAFFTRNGGASQGAYASLNFSFAVGDEPARVEENLRRAGDVLGVAAERICFVSQVHGRAVVELGPRTARPEIMKHEADAVLARSGALACSVRSADCVPILLADERSGAVAAVHSGWRGTVLNAVAAAVERLNTDPARVLAAIGPHISRASFEVGADVANQLQAVVPHTPVVTFSSPDDKPHVDLRLVVQSQLQALGVASIDHVLGCTYGEVDRFFSFRRDGRHSGRLLSAIVPR